MFSNGMTVRQSLCCRWHEEGMPVLSTPSVLPRSWGDGSTARLVQLCTEGRPSELARPRSGRPCPETSVLLRRIHRARAHKEGNTDLLFGRQKTSGKLTGRPPPPRAPLSSAPRWPGPAGPSAPGPPSAGGRSPAGGKAGVSGSAPRGKLGDREHTSFHVMNSLEDAECRENDFF